MKNDLQAGLQNIIDAINNLIEPKLGSLRYDKTFRAKIISDEGNNVYGVQINGKNYKAVYTGEKIPVGQIVKVKAPLNNFSDIYIETLPGSVEEEPDIIDVKKYGAIGDGTTDDTNAIQNCINNFPHRTIFFSQGNYKISAPLQIYEDNESQVDLYFESGSKLFSESEINALIEIGNVKSGVTTHWKRYSLGDIVTISGSGILDAQNCNKAIYICSNRHFNRLMDLNIVNCNAYGIYVDKATLSGVSNSTDSQFLNINITGSGDPNANTIGFCLLASDNEFNNIRLQRFNIGFQLYGGGNIIDNVHMTQGFISGGNIATNFNKSIGFEFNGIAFDMLSNIYVDTYGKAFVFNAENKYTVMNNVYTYYYFNTAESITNIFTLSKKCRLNVQNSRFELTGKGTNTIINLSSITDNNFRRNFIAYNYLHFENCTTYHSSLTDLEDPYNCLQVRGVESTTIVEVPYSVYMEGGNHYPFAVLEEGTYNFKVSMENSEMIDVVCYIPNTGTPILKTTSIFSQGTHKDSWSLSLCEKETKDNRRYVYLCVISDRRWHYNPTIFNVSKNFLNAIFTYTGFYDYKALTNPTVLVETPFNVENS